MCWGKKLYLRIEDIVGSNQKPIVSKDTDLNGVILEITSNRLGATVVMENSDIIGIITDGDLRRMLQKTNDILGIRAVDIMNDSPICIPKDMLVAEALEIMETEGITQLLVINEGKYLGIVHLHDIIKEGII